MIYYYAHVRITCNSPIHLTCSEYTYSLLVDGTADISADMEEVGFSASAAAEVPLASHTHHYTNLQHSTLLTVSHVYTLVVWMEIKAVVDTIFIIIIQKTKGYVYIHIYIHVHVCIH